MFCQSCDRPGSTGRTCSWATWFLQVLEKMTESQAVGAKRRRLEAEHGLLGDVRSQRVREGSLADALSDYVERIDTDMVGLPGLT